MKKFFRFPLYFFCLSLLSISCYLLVKPISAYAADCSTTCANGTHISVSGTTCGCSNQVGCSYQTAQGGSYRYASMCSF